MESRPAQRPLRRGAGVFGEELLQPAYRLLQLRATGQDYRLGGDTAEQLLSAVQEQAAMSREYQGSGEPADVPAGAGDLETAVALSGRNPYWAG